MRRFWMVVVALGCTLLATTATRGAETTADEIRYFDRTQKKEVTVKNAVIQEETPAHVVFRQGTTTKDVPVGDVLGIDYKVGAGNLPTIRKAERNEDLLEKPGTDAADRKKAFEEALTAYRSLLTDLKEPSLLPHVQFRVARLLARRAEEDPEQVDAAITELGKFIKDNPNSWEVSRAARLLGGLQEAKGDLAGAQQTYQNLALAEVPKEVKQQAELMTAQLLIRANNANDARRKLEKMASQLSANDPQQPRVQVYLAVCDVAGGKYAAAEDKLKALLGGEVDNDVKGLIYNALGDICRETNRPEEAFWDYLWVDAVYNQDRSELAKALYYLSKLFLTVKNDGARAAQCRERLLNDKEFVGLEYHNRAAREKGE